MDENENINRILNEINSYEKKVQDYDDNGVNIKLIYYLIGKNIIVLKGNHLILDILGIDIINSGGWIKYKSKERKDKLWKDFQIKFDVISKPVLVLIAASSLIFAILQYYNNKQLSLRIIKLESDIAILKIKSKYIESPHIKSTPEKKRQ